MIALLLCLFAQGDGNRLWWLELELMGSAEALTVDCGADGTTHVPGPFLAGGARRLRVPVPMRSPLGSEGLALLPLPRVEGEAARVVGWCAEQPDDALVRGARGLLARARPPAGGGPARAGGPEAWLVLLLLPLLLRWRRRFLLFLVVALAGGAFVFVRTRARPARNETVELLELDLPARSAVRIRAARDELELPLTRLEARPDGQALRFEFHGDGSAGRVRARGTTLFALEPSACPALPTEPGPALDATWVRSPGGEWIDHGPWPAGAALGPPLRPGTHPPGWLTGAMPPGVGLLVGRTSGGGWLRASGFPGEERADGY